MKPFLKAVLLINHTDNKDQVDFGQLQLLAEQKNLVKDQKEFDEIVSRLDDMCVALIRQNPSSVDDFNDLIARFGFEDEKSQKELMQVWESEKEGAFSHLLKKAANSRKLDNIQWSLNSKFYTKKAKSMNSQITAVFALKTSQYDNTKPSHLSFELSPQELDSLYNDLQNIEDEIAALSSNSQTAAGESA